MAGNLRDAVIPAVNVGSSIRSYRSARLLFLIPAFQSPDPDSSPALIFAAGRNNHRRFNFSILISMTTSYLSNRCRFRYIKMPDSIFFLASHWYTFSGSISLISSFSKCLNGVKSARALARKSVSILGAEPWYPAWYSHTKSIIITELDRVINNSFKFGSDTDGFCGSNGSCETRHLSQRTSA